MKTKDRAVGIAIENDGGQIVSINIDAIICAECGEDVATKGHAFLVMISDEGTHTYSHCICGEANVATLKVFLFYLSNQKVKP